MNSERGSILSLLGLVRRKAAPAPVAPVVVVGQVAPDQGADPEAPGNIRRVEAFAIGHGAALRFLTSGSVTGDGRYELEVPGDVRFLLIEAVDGQGQLAGSCVLEPTSGERWQARPLDRHSSLEAEVFLATGAKPWLWPQVRRRVDASVVALLDSEAELRPQVAALAAAVNAEVAYEAHAFEEVGLDHRNFESAALQVAAELSEALHRGRADAYDLFFEALGAARAATGASTALLRRIEVGAALAFRATLRAFGALGLLRATSVEGEDDLVLQSTTGFLAEE